MRDRWSGMDGYRRYQDLIFQAIYDSERLSRWTVEAKKRADAERLRRIQYEKIDHLRPQLVSLGCLAGVPDLKANIWAFDLVDQAKCLWIAKEEHTEHAHD